MKYVFLGGYRLNQVQADSKSPCNWLFLPGGPGMGAEYLVDFVHHLKVPGNLFVADFPGDGSNRDTGEISYNAWKLGLLTILDELKPCILVGHSFGGMFSLTIPELENLLSGIIFISCTPDKGWLEELVSTARTYNLPNISGAVVKFYNEPTDYNLKLLFYANIPYLFLPHEKEDGKLLLKKSSYNAKARIWAYQNFHLTYKYSWYPIKLPACIIGSLDDRLLPAGLFRKYENFIRPNIQIMELNNTGHFPWLSKFKEINKALLDFYYNIEK